VEDETEEYLKVMSEMRKINSQPVVMAMPTVCVTKAVKKSSNGNLLPEHKKIIDSLFAAEAILNKDPASIPKRPHQERIASTGYTSEEYFNLIHTPVPMNKAMQIPQARAAVQLEWDKLVSKSAWILSSVRERADVMRDLKDHEVAHFGSLMDLCHEKNSQMAPEYRKYKGRVVFRGDQVKQADNESWGAYKAVFSEQGTGASHMAGAKFADLVGRLPGCKGQNSDAVSAYTQEKLGGPPTWISLPRAQWPKDGSWDHFKDPVCRLDLNLYGHPLAGFYWERRCKRIILGLGFTLVPGWECLYIHKEKQLLLSVYVDDFKLSGPEENIAPMWKLLGKEIELEDPTEFHGNTYLGCTQAEFEPDHDMMESVGELFKEVTKKASGAERKETQTADTTRAPNVTKPSLKPPATEASLKAYHYCMAGHSEQAVERYLELSGKKEASLAKVATACIDDHLLQAEDFITKGQLEESAAKIVLKVLYAARMGRPDIYWAVNTLARDVTKWNVACDKRLHRLICYIHHTKHYVQKCVVGDKIDDCVLAMFVDASFAGDLTDSKSTTGAMLYVIGPHTMVPITWICKKQGAVSHSSSEAEVIALDAAVRMEGLPALQLFDILQELFGSRTTSPFKDPDRTESYNSPDDTLMDFSVLDYVPCNIPLSRGLGFM